MRFSGFGDACEFGKLLCRNNLSMVPSPQVNV